MIRRFVMRMVDPTLPRYGTDLMTLQSELLHESSLALASLILTGLKARCWRDPAESQNRFNGLQLARLVRRRKPLKRFKLFIVVA